MSRTDSLSPHLHAGEAQHQRTGSRAVAILLCAALASCGGGSGGESATSEVPPPPPPPAGVLQFDAASYTVDEVSQTATFAITRTGGSSGEVSVQVSTADGTAVAGSDYGATTTTATFSDGDTGAKSGTVIIFNDSDHEAEETINLALSAATGGATIGDQNSAVVTIVDDDPVRITVGGDIEGLAGGGLTLRNNGGDDVPVGSSEDGFVFPTSLVEGDSYDVTVSVQPWAPAQSCEVINGQGTAGPADVTDVLVSCTDVPLQSLLIHRTVGGQRDLYFVREDGSGFVTLADTVESETFQGLAGQRLVYTADGNIYSILPDGNDRLALAGQPEGETFGGIAGDLVFFQRQAGLTAATDDLYVIGADGTGLTLLAGTSDDEEYVGFSTDGQGDRVIYRRTVGGQDDIYSVRTDGSDTLAIAASSDFEEFAAVTLEGRILFYRLNVDYDLYSVAADGTGLAALATGAGDYRIGMLLDGDRLLYRHEPSPGQFDLFAVNSDGTEHAVLADTTVSEWLEGVTTAGRVVFRRQLSGHTDLYAVNADGTTLATLADTPFTEFFAGALPDGRVLYVRADAAQPDLSDLFAVDADGTGTMQLTDTVEYEAVYPSAFMASGRLVFARVFNGRDDLFSMALDGSDVRRLTDTPDADENIVGITASGGVVYYTYENGDTNVYRIGADGNGFVALAVTPEAEAVAKIF